MLVYGHFDVQPAEPLALWTTPPFAPTLFTHADDGPALRARGAADDKGCLAAALQGLHAVAATGSGAFPVNLKFLLEGQEEIGSPQLEAFIRAHARLLAADVALSADGEQHSGGAPSLTLGYRGAVALRLRVRTAAGDLHSGSFGGSVANAAHVLASVLAALHTAEGAVAAPRFYDDVAPLTAAQREAFAALPRDDAADKAAAGAARMRLDACCQLA